MKKQPFFLLLLSLVFFTANALCARSNNMINITRTTAEKVDILKNSIYFHIAEVKKSENKISANEKLALQREYEGIKIKINAVYWKMAQDVTLFEPNSVAYERYTPELDPLIKEAYSYMDKVNKALNRNPVGVGKMGIDVLIPMIMDIGGKIKGYIFYNKLRWKSWKDLK